MIDSLPEQVLEHSRLLLQGGSLGLFLLAGALHPRVRDQKLINPDLFKNLTNGLVLFAFSMVASRFMADQIQ